MTLLSWVPITSSTVQSMSQNFESHPQHPWYSATQFVYNFTWMALTVCMLYAHTANAKPANTTSGASVFEFKNCAQQTQRMLTRTYAQLPTDLRDATPSPLHVHCTSGSFPFGFSLHTQHTRQVLQLGVVAPGAPRRTEYRLAHLTDLEKAQLWHQR